MTERTGLRAARTGRGWSQAEAGAELRALARRRGGPEASAASLKTQLSRWENGHAVPDGTYRELLAELYERSADELGLLPPAPERGPDDADRLRAALAAAAAVDDDTLRLWEEQLALARRLDDELGAAGAGGLVGALVEQLARALDHTVTASRRISLARMLCPAAVLAGDQALDQGDPGSAWRHYATARTAAAESRSPADLGPAIAGQCEVLGELGLADTVPEPLDDVRPGPVVDAVHGPDTPAIELSDRHRGHTLATLHDPAAIRSLEGALAARPRSARHRAWLHADLAHALSAAGRTEDAAEHARTARELATRIGSARLTARLGVPPRLGVTERLGVPERLGNRTSHGAPAGSTAGEVGGDRAT